jgi:phosphoglycolate phosphatase
LKRLFIFDLDGTLVDSREDIARACNHALIAHGREPLSRAEIQRFVGDGARALVARAFGVAHHAPEVDAPLASFYEFYVAHACDATTLLPGVMNALDRLRSQGLLAVCTNKPRETTVLVLEGLGLARYFGRVYAGGDGPLKPDPFGIHACCKHFDVAAEHAWMIGDGPQDVRAGKNAGTRTLGIATALFASRDDLEASAPDALVAAFDDMMALLTESPA